MASLPFERGPAGPSVSFQDHPQVEAIVGARHDDPSPVLGGLDIHLLVEAIIFRAIRSSAPIRSSTRSRGYRGSRCGRRTRVGSASLATSTSGTGRRTPFSTVEWRRAFHIDVIRVNAVASMLYLDCSRRAGVWIPKRFGGRENLEAIAFFAANNKLVFGETTALLQWRRNRLPGRLRHTRFTLAVPTSAINGT
jgi:hypothetical protein